MNEEALKEADKRAKKKLEALPNQFHDRLKYTSYIRGSDGFEWDRPNDPYNLPYDRDTPRPPSSSFNITGKPFCGYGNSEQMPEEKQEVTYTWDQPRVKDPGADYKPGKFKHLDEAILNSKKK